jgi:hypothetical protein
MTNKGKNNHQKQKKIIQTLICPKVAKQTREVNGQKGQLFFYQQKFMCLGLWR